jgi:phage/plasmid primase-like uncharacterized protein
MTFDQPDIESAFCAALRERKIIPPDKLIADGKIHRCDAEGKHGKNDAAYLIHLDSVPAGGMENHRDGLEWTKWNYGKREDYDPKLWAAAQEQIREAARKREQERARVAALSKADCQRVWEGSAKDRPHPYTDRKGTTSIGLRVTTQEHEFQYHGEDRPPMVIPKGSLVVPARDADGEIHALQFIGDDTKLFPPGSVKTGHFDLIGKVGDVLCIAEGPATARTIHEATGHAVAGAFDCGNLLPVAKALRAKYPKARIVIGADDDWKTPGNPGTTKGKAAAKAVDGIMVIPEFGPARSEKDTDWNDLATLLGQAEVKRQFEKAIAATSLQLASAMVQIIFSRKLPPPVETPFPQLNKLLGGGMRGVNVVAGATGRGKTGFGLTQARYTARTRPVLYLSTEIDERQAMARIAAQDRGCPWRPLYEGTAPDTLAIVAGALTGLRLYVATCNSVETMLTKLAELAVVESEPALLVLDYLQGLSRTAEDRRLAVGAASEALTAWTRNTGGTVEAISSIARAHYFETDSKSATDFVGVAKESGDVEFDASSVMFVDVPPPPLGGQSEGRLHVAKSRFGSAGTIGLFFDGPSGCFQADPAGGLTEDQRAVMEAIEDGARSGNAIAKEAGIRRVKVEACLRVLRSRNLIDAHNNLTGESRKQDYNSTKNAASLPGNTSKACPDSETVGDSPSEKVFPGTGKQAVLVDGVSPPYRGKPGNTGDPNNSNDTDPYREDSV